MTDDAAAIAALLPSGIRRAEQSARMLAAHLAAHPGYVAWSGGRDSTCAVVLATRIAPAIPVVWFDSGLEYPENRAYMHQLARDLRLNFHALPARPTALELLAQTGAWDHAAPFHEPTRSAAFHDALIRTPAAHAHAQFGNGEVLGLRAGESVGRRLLLASGHGTFTRADGTVACAPLWRWTTRNVTGFLHREGVPENPVYARLRALGAPEHAQRVGLVIDGNAAEHGRYAWLRAGWPDLWQQACDVLPRLREWR